MKYLITVPKSKTLKFVGSTVTSGLSPASSERLFLFVSAKTFAVAACSAAATLRGVTIICGLTAFELSMKID